jgi:predicted nucleic acid-binding protein
MPLQIVIDTNILVAAARSNNGASFELLRLFGAGDIRWEWNISTALLLEYEAVLKREQHRQGRPLDVVDRLLDLLLAVPIATRYSTLSDRIYRIRMTN